MLNVNIKKTNNYSNYKAEFFLLFATLLWGSTFPLIKILLHSWDSTQILFYRFFISSILLFLMLVYKNQLKFNLKILFYGIITGLLGYFAYYFQTEGLRFTTPTRSAFFTQMFIIFVFIIEFFVFQKAIQKHQWFSLFTILFGAYILFFRFDVSLTILYEDSQKGDLLTLLSAFCYALYLILISQLKGNFLNILLIHFLTISLIPLLFLKSISITIDKHTILSITILSVLATFLTNIILFYFQPKISSIKGSILYSMEPVFAFVFSFFLTKDTYTLNEYIGSLLIFLGSICGSINKTNSKQNNT